MQREANRKYDHSEKGREKRRERRRKYKHSEKGREKGRERRRKYRHSEKGREANRKYDHSEKGREKRRKYKHSEKGREANRKYDRIRNAKRNPRRVFAGRTWAGYAKTTEEAQAINARLTSKLSEFKDEKRNERERMVENGWKHTPES